MLVGSQVHENHIDWESANRISNFSHNLLTSSRLAAGDLVTVRVGDPGVTAVISPELEGCNCASMMIVRQHQSFISAWLCYMMNSRLGRSQVEHVQYGTAQKQFNISDAINFLYPVPPLPEQRSIAQALSDVDTLIAALNKIIVKKRNIKTATMQQLLTGKKRLPGFVKGQGYRHTEVGVIPEDWDVTKLKDTAPLQRGFDLPTSQLKKNDYPVVYSNGVMNHHLDFMVTGPGVITGRSGTIGNVHYVSKNYWPHNTALWITDFKGNDPKYIYYLYKSVNLEQFGTGYSVPTLNRNDVHDRAVAIPQVEEQRAIATVLSDMDAEIAALETRLTKTQAIKQGMMQALLTGRIRLKIEA